MPLTTERVRCERNDTIIYGKYGGSDIEVGGQEMKILRESDILEKVL